MSPEPVVDLGPTAEAVAALLPGIRDDQLADPTPCPAYALGDLLDHLGGLSLAFTAAARKDWQGLPDGPGSSDGARLEEGWRERIRDQLAALALAWRTPGAWSGETRAGGVDLPGGAAGMVALDEVLVHGWDVARASGQSVRYDEAALRVALGVVGAPREADAGDGLFGPPVAVADDAPLLDRVVALSGRDPAWGPPR